MGLGQVLALSRNVLRSRHKGRAVMVPPTLPTVSLCSVATHCPTPPPGPTLGFFSSYISGQRHCHLLSGRVSNGSSLAFSSINGGLVFQCVCEMYLEVRSRNILGCRHIKDWHPFMAFQSFSLFFFFFFFLVDVCVELSNSGLCV